VPSGNIGLRAKPATSRVVWKLFKVTVERLCRDVELSALILQVPPFAIDSHWLAQGACVLEIRLSGVKMSVIDEQGATPHPKSLQLRRLLNLLVQPAQGAGDPLMRRQVVQRQQPANRQQRFNA
jgi:hypothetical protein